MRFSGRGFRYSQLTDGLRHAIRRGDFPPGSRLPTSRSLARDLACARNIVLLAYEHLTLEGYVIGRVGAGTFVAGSLPAPTIARVSSHSPSPGLTAEGARRVRIALQAFTLARLPGGLSIDFEYGASVGDDRLLTNLRRVIARRAARAPAAYLDPAGDRPLRALLAERVGRRRGIRCTAEQVIVTSGSQQALDLCARLFVGRGTTVAVEDPGYQGAGAVFEAAGARIVPVAVDAEGLMVRTLTRRTGSRLVYVTPSHQFPTGAVMSAARRHELLAWAGRVGARIIEDDYDTEFRHEGRLLEALAAIDDRGLVIYCGTFARSLPPSLRLGYVVFPPELVEAAIAVKWLTDRGGPVALQQALHDLLTNGDYDRAVKRMSRLVRERRDALVAALRRELGDEVVVAGAHAGLHLVAWFPRLSSDSVERLVAEARQRGVGVYPLAPYSTRPAARAGLILGYGSVSVRQISEGVHRIAEAFRAVRSG